MRGNYEWKVKRSNKPVVHLVCKIDNCTWKLRAVRRDEGTYFQVRSFVNEHSCPLKEVHRRHRQANAVIICEVIAHRLQQHDSRLMRPNDIITDMKTMYNFMAAAQDGNEQAYPIDFSYGDSENNASWEWFLDCLKGAFGNIEDLVFIFDRHAIIKSGIASVFPYATHTICAWHFSENKRKCFHRKDVAQIMFVVAKSYRELQFNRHMEELRNLSQNAYDYVVNVGPEKWSYVH
ncbi:hypothetical protein Dsin_005144 [Dipteronia sinensis]|uniref:MULE transposase domain-containing protein n=1 Tax=Dipteronia sinensis TaxID=43782 RepID=A0AAE0AX98_9ROSI|nr:hypothetical protein Dsin_005144 [Dipteronia sinensis]